jgi:GPI mannosyltransferase 3
VHHHDEVGQYLEQANRYLNGYGLIPWEYQVGMRTWLFPLLLAGPMALGDAIAPGTMAYVIFPKLLTVFASLGLVWSAYQIGLVSSRTHAFVAMVVACFWFEFLYFASHTLTEPVATSAILSGAALLYLKPLRQKHLMLAGFLFGIGFILRFHYAPAIAVLILFALYTDFKSRVVPLLAGGIAALVIGAAVDFKMNMTPYWWIYENIYQNIVLRKAESFGVQPANFYSSALYYYWNWLFYPIILLTIPAIKRYRALFYTAAVNIIVHSAIGHKEYRFIFLSTSIIVILSVIGSLDVLRFLQKRLSAIPAKATPYIVIGVWAAASLFLATTPKMKYMWNAYNGSMKKMVQAGRDPKTCAIAMNEDFIWVSGSKVYSKRDLPIYLRKPEMGEDMTVALQPSGSLAFNTVIAADSERDDIDAAYKKIDCMDATAEIKSGRFRAKAQKVCLYRREGPCEKTDGNYPIEAK